MNLTVFPILFLFQQPIEYSTLHSISTFLSLHSHGFHYYVHLKNIIWLAVVQHLRMTMLCIWSVQMLLYFSFFLGTLLHCVLLTVMFTLTICLVCLSISSSVLFQELSKSCTSVTLFIYFNTMKISNHLLPPCHLAVLECNSASCLQELSLYSMPPG